MAITAHTSISTCCRLCSTWPSLRYSPRVMLCAYIIVAHPGAVLNGQGERVQQLMESEVIFVREFELLTKVVLGDRGQRRFGAQLAGFDKAW